MKCLALLRYLKDFFPMRGISVDWKISNEQRQQLRSLKGSAGWKVYLQRLKGLETEVRESLAIADQPHRIFRMQGQLVGLEQVYSLVERLLEVDSPAGAEGYLQRQADETVEGMDPDVLMALGLGDQ